MSPRRLLLTAALLGCAAPPASGAAIFAVALDAVPGGALLSAWVAPGTAHRGWIVGGLVGVDPDRVADGRVGRLVQMEGATLRTVCHTPRVLWWVEAVRDATGEVVYACGEGGLVLRYAQGRCETLPLDVRWDEGLPTFWGLRARSSTDVTLVGGASGDGPRGVLVHYDGQHFTRQDDALPAAARHRNLYKIAEGALGAFVVGEGGTLLQRDAEGRWAPAAPSIAPGDARLFTVSCDALAPRCYAVGGGASGVVLRGESNGWTLRTDLDDLPGLSGVWMQDANSIFLVGGDGLTMHTNTVSDYRPATAPTPAPLHAVTGNASLVVAVGGELGRAEVTQRGVLLVRGSTARTFTLDGQHYTARGEIRPTLGGGVGGGQ